MYAMKWLGTNISQEIDVFIHMENSGEAMKWVLQHHRGTSVTYNGCSYLSMVIIIYILWKFWIKGYLPQVMSQSIILKDMLSLEVE
jgi:hypothetical protein